MDLPDAAQWSTAAACTVVLGAAIAIMVPVVGHTLTSCPFSLRLPLSFNLCG